MWDYAKLSKLAKELGGPEEMIRIIRESGVVAGRRNMYPLVGAAALVGGGIALVGRRCIKLIAERESERQLKVAAAETGIISAVNAASEVECGEMGDEASEECVSAS